MRALLSADTYDHPIVFVFALSLVMIPVLYFVYLGASRLGVALPALGQPA